MTQPLASEALRLQALKSFRLLDTPPEAALDGFVRLAAELLHAPTAFISLLDEERQFFKARYGFAPQELPRKGSFCGMAIQGTDLFIVPDAGKDPLFHDHPIVVGEPFFRFYAATPLLTARNEAIGTLCVLDVKPRLLAAEHAQALRALGRQLMSMLEQRRVSLLRDAALRALDRELRDEVDGLRALATSALGRPDLGRSEGARTVRVLAAAERLDSTIDAVCELLRVGLGAPLHLRPELVDLARLCSDAIAELAQGVGVAFRFTAEGDCRGLWDPARLQQAALLLFEESRARSRDFGHVRVAARAHGDHVELEVALPAPETEIITLRIQLARELIEAQGGAITFRRVPGTSTFRVLLPRTPPGA